VLDDRYTLIEKLGGGGQGSVWKAFDKNTGQHRALKIVDLHDSDDEASARALREARLVRDARHPALVTCHSAHEIQSERLLLLVFDFVEATPLSAALDNERFGRAHRLAALRHIARALAYLHREKIVHRDLKPDNVLVVPVFWEDPAAPSGIKIIDFGIAAPPRGPDGATLSGMFGTPPYMAPELFGAPNLDGQRSPARDVFAFGVMGWELLEGGHPTGLPRGAGAGEYRRVYERCKRGADPWPPRALEGRWGSVVAACLALDPSQRPRDGAAILAAIDEAPATPAPPEAAKAGPGGAAQNGDPRMVGSTARHVAPDELPSRSAVPRTMTDPAPSPPATIPSEPRAIAVVKTEPAPPSSLPRASGVDRTTPMVPEPAPSPKEVPAPPRGARRLRPLALVIGAAVIGGGLWALLGTGSDALDAPPGPTSAPSLAPPTSMGSTASAGSTAPSATGGASAQARESTASAGASASGSSPKKQLVVCCNQDNRCRPGIECKKAPECTHEVDRDEPLNLRIVLVRGKEEIYEDWKDLAKPDQYPKSEVCVSTDAKRVCVSMHKIAQKALAKDELLPIVASDIIDGRIRLKVSGSGRKKPIDVMLEPQRKLQSKAMCGTLSLEDKGGLRSLVSYLEIPSSSSPAESPKPR
jgi:serine/threonine-protein kinase